MNHNVNGLLSFCAIKGDRRHSFSLQEKLHTHRNSVTQRESDTLRLATDTDMPSDIACLRSLHAEVGQCILA
jgi:hypothetical protein